MMFAAQCALAALFEQQVDRRLSVPPEEQERYGALLEEHTRGLTVPQYALLVDRCPRVQAVFVYFLEPGAAPCFVGAAPVSTGLPGRFEYFATPLGLYTHSPDHPDFRAEGTRNVHGVRGYGLKGMRVFDFGWVKATKGWGDGRASQMRLQVHATDPDLLEPLLGRALSKGCIRIPASLNTFLDVHGLLDADYLEAGRPFAVLRADRQAVEWPGRYLVVVDTGRRERPAWSPGRVYDRQP